MDLKKYRPLCQVPSCYNNRKNNITSQILHSFYRIPGFKREKARKNWLAKMNITEEYLNAKKLKNYHVCDRHFCSDDYTGSFIRLNAVPSLHLEYQENIPGFPSSTNLTKSNSPSNNDNVYNFNEEDINEQENFDCSDNVSSSSFFDSDAEIPLLNSKKQFSNLVIESHDSNCNDFSNDFPDDLCNDVSSNNLSSSESPLIVEIDIFHSSVAVQTKKMILLFAIAFV